MLTKITIRNFKRFGEVEIELGSPVVFIGPNNSGKTSAMQALALWDIGLKRWNEKRSGKGAPERRKGVTVNRRDLVAIPVPEANLLWRGLHVRDTHKVAGQQKMNNVRVDITVEGVTKDREWACGLEFDYANPESFYCRPLRLDDDGNKRMPVPPEAGTTQIALLPPMSGLVATETRLDDGAINVRVGDGRTAEVLRNLCYQIQEKWPDKWNEIQNQVQNLFGVKLGVARYIPERGEIAMSYREYREKDVELDLSSSGRGLQQTLLLLAYRYANPGAVLLLDEPDAHLEILRQRQTYKLITDVARDSGSQIIAASHSEVLLNEAADKDMVIAFVGKPHRIDDRKSQVLKALREIGFEQYYQAEQTGWVLYLEGSTDLAILQAFARRLEHKEAEETLLKPFVHYVGNKPTDVHRHYHGLREALPNLEDVAIFDRLESEVPGIELVDCLMWKQREIENYLCSQTTLERYVQASAHADILGSLFSPVETEKRTAAMHEAIGEITEAMTKLGKGSPWSADTKVSDEFLTPLFDAYFKKLGLPNLMNKNSFYELAEHVPEDEIDPEIREKLDAIVRTANSAKPRVSED